MVGSFFSRFFFFSASLCVEKTHSRALSVPIFWRIRKYRFHVGSVAFAHFNVSFVFSISLFPFLLLSVLPFFFPLITFYLHSFSLLWIVFGRRHGYSSVVVAWWLRRNFQCAVAFLPFCLFLELPTNCIFSILWHKILVFFSASLPTFPPSFFSTFQRAFFMVRTRWLSYHIYSKMK